MITIEELRAAQTAAARIVEKLGDEYLIFFERIHSEIILAESKKGLRSLALEVAKRS